MSATHVAVLTQAQPHPRTRIQTRYRLVMAGALAVLAALIVIALANNVYNTAYTLFDNIAVVNSTNVDAAEEALQYIANASQSTADYAALASDTPLFEQAQNNIFRNFHRFRDEMFILQQNLHTLEDRSAFTVADTYTYSRFWRHVSNLLSQRSNLEAARREYLSADNHLRNRIIPALQELEALNFQEMVNDGDRAGGDIITRVILLVIPAVGLAVGLTYLSFWLRQKVRRYLTPGIDIAMVLGWLLIALMVLELTRLPNELSVMTRDSYFSISGSSRVLVVANQANRAESSAVIDSTRPDYWYEIFDTNMDSLELRICGQPRCMEKSFLVPNTADELEPAVGNIARHIAPDDSEAIDNMIPLIANITFDGEATALEVARLAYLEYRAVNAQLRELIDNGQIDDAVALNTTPDVSGSEEAFGRFVQAMATERAINRSVFDNIWDAQRSGLSRNQVLYGSVGYFVLALLVVVGVYHRFREL